MRKLLFILMIPLSVAAQQDSLRKRPDVFRFTDGVLYTYSAPARWKGKDWITLGGVLAGAAAVTLLDEPVRDFWHWQGKSNFMDGVEEVGFHYGKPYSAFTFTGGFYLAGLVLKNKWCKETAIVLGTGLLTSGLLQTIMKDAVGRARPDTEVGNYTFKPFRNDPAYHAFPSGHFAVAFGISLTVASRTESVPLKIFFYSLAASTAVGRMYADSHWLSDIAIGGTMAWFCVNTALNRIEVNGYRPPRKQNKVSWHLYPRVGGLTLCAKL